MKKLLAMLLAAGMILSLAACSQNEKPSDSSQDPGKTLKIGLVLGTGGLGDKNFNDMAYEGITQAQADLGIVFDYVEPSSISDYTPNLRSMCEAEEYDLIIGLGTDMSDSLTEVSEDFPDQKFSHIDSFLELPNVSSVSTKWQEQTFMAGVVAGLGTKSDMEFANEENVIGVILGQENPSLRRGIVGYIAGAKFVNPDVTVLEGNVDNFNDPGTGKEMALSMYNQGADFIQAIAGASGMGIYNASNEAGAYSFGVGANVNYIQPDNIVGTSARTVDKMVYNEIKAMVEGTWSAGMHVSGMKEGAVGYDATDSNVKLPDDIQKAVDEITQMMIDGELVPPESMDEIDAWVAENQYAK
jgi:basic membrane protein A